METSTATTPDRDVSGLFTRNASGLVRVAGGFDTFIYSIGLIGVGSGIFTGFFFRSSYPGSSFALATLIAGIAAVFVSLSFYFWSIIFPRSGGTFIFLSRSIGPGIAFPLSFFEVIAFIFFASLNAMFMVQVGIAPLFASLGILTDANFDGLVKWLGTETGTFIVGASILIITGLIPMLGMRAFLRVQRVMFGIAVLGLVLGVIVMIFKSRTGFDHDFTDATGLTRDGVIAAASKSGLHNASFSLDATLKFTVWIVGYLFFAVTSSAIGGEIKSVRRSQFIGMVGATVVATLAILVYIPLAAHTFGIHFMDSLVWNSTAAPKASTTATPYVTLLLGIASPNAVIGAIVIIGFIAWLYFLVSPQLIYSQRLMVAWSFDRLAPQRLGYVSERANSPIVAIAVSLVIAVAFLALLAYGVMALFAYTMGVFAVWVLVTLVGGLFPWLRRDLYRSSAAARYKLFGIPAMTLVGIPAAACLAWQVVFYWRDSLVAGHSNATITATVAALGAGIVWYVGFRAFRKSQGVDLDKTFRELPIE